MVMTFRKVSSPKRGRSPVHPCRSPLRKPPAACLPPSTPRKSRAPRWTFKRCTEIVSSFFRGAFHGLSINLIVFITLLVIVMVGYPLESIQQKVQAPKEMTEMKKIVEVMKKKVRNAETACLNVEDELCCMHLGIQDDSTDTTDIRNISFCSSHSDNTVSLQTTQPEHTDYIREVLYPDNLTNSCKEIAIMSYLYTDSFNAIHIRDDNKNKLYENENVTKL